MRRYYDYLDRTWVLDGTDTLDPSIPGNRNKRNLFMGTRVGIGNAIVPGFAGDAVIGVVGELPHSAQAIDLAGKVSGWGVREGKPIHPCVGGAKTSYRTARAVPL